jgi:large repetitive protein
MSAVLSHVERSEGSMSISRSPVRARSRRSARKPRVEPLERRDLLASYTTLEDTPLIVSDPELASLEVVQQPEHGTVTPTSVGGFAYVPAQDYFGPDSFTYITGELPASAATTVSITVSPVNDSPVAVDDELTTPQGVSLTITPARLLENDKDVDSNALRVTLLSGGGPRHGTLTMTPSGNFIYHPRPDFSGADGFQYFAWDGEAFSQPATVTIKVTPVLRLPEVRNDFYSTPVNTTLEIKAPGVLANDGPFGNFEVQAELVEKPALGELSFAANGGFKYVPPSDFTGTATFTYRLLNNSLDPTTNTTLPIAGNIATVTIAVRPVNVPPQARNDFYRTTENVTLTVGKPGVLANDHGNSDRPLYSLLVSRPAHGEVVLRLDGSFTYAPAKDYVGTDAFVYQATHTLPTTLAANVVDGPVSNSSLATVTIAVAAVNVPPQARNDQYTTLQGAPLEVAAPGVLANDSGPDGQRLAAVRLTEPQNGELVLRLDGSFVYRPRPGFSGLDSFTYRAVAPQTNTNGAPPAPGDSALANTSNASDVATVSIYVRPINPAPIAQDDTYKMIEGGSLRVAAPGVLANDRTPTGYTLKAEALTNPRGTLTLAADGSFSYTPVAGFTGIDTFTYRAVAVALPTPTDPSLAGSLATTEPSQPPGANLSAIATVAIFVRPLNPLPEARDDYFVIAQKTTLTVERPGVLRNDSAPTGHVLSAELLTKPVHGELAFNADGSFSYTPTGDYTGSDTFTYRAVGTALSPVPAAFGGDTSATPDDNLLPRPPHDVATVTIFIRPLNPAPEARPDFYTVAANATLSVEKPGVLANDLAPAGQALSAKLVREPAQGELSLAADGSFRYTPALNYTGPVTFAYRAVGTAIVEPTPDLPLAATSLAGSSLTAPLERDVAVVTIYVTPVRPPVDAHDDRYTTRQGQTLTIAAPGVLANDLRAVNAALIATVVEEPAHGTLSLAATGAFTYTPPEGFTGEVKFAYRASLAVTTAADPASNTTQPASDVATVTILVLPDEELPKFTLPASLETTDDSGPQQLADFVRLISISGQTPPNFDLSTDNLRLFASPPTIDAAGRLIYTPAPNVRGSATVRVLMHDGDSTHAASEQTFTIEVQKPFPLYNAVKRWDVNADNNVAPGDVLAIVNYLNAIGAGPVNASPVNASAVGDFSGEDAVMAYYDVNQDNYISPIDALMVINYLNANSRSAAASGAEGEYAAAADLSLLALVFDEGLDAAGKRKRST